MNKCPKCGKEYDGNLNFCQNCGTPIEEKEFRFCSKCGKQNDSDAKFCKECGQKLGSGVFKCSKCGATYPTPDKICKECGGKVIEDGAEDAPAKLPHDMVYVEGGSLWLGDDGWKDNPRHKVTLDSFYISKYQVTQKLWNSVMSYDHSEHIGKNRPVDSVSWYDVVVFCNALSKKEGRSPCYRIDKSREDPNNKSKDDDLKWTVKCNFMADGYRLPTEAEWEYAARGGQESEGYKYAGSDNLDVVGWYYDNSDDETHDVGEKEPNELGLHDISGNVWEWCWDWYDYRRINGRRNLTWASSGWGRVRRGGSCYGDNYCAVAFRSNVSPNLRHDDCGFRLVCSSS